jgi:hypothetical protein
VPGLELDWGKHAQCRATALAIVEDLEVLEDRVRQLHPSPPAPTVQALDLHPAPERLDHGVMEATPDRDSVLVIIRAAKARRASAGKRQ